MILFKKFREKRINKIMEAVYKKNLWKRYIMLLTGCLIVAFAFNLPTRPPIAIADEEVVVSVPSNQHSFIWFVTLVVVL